MGLIKEQALKKKILGNEYIIIENFKWPHILIVGVSEKGEKYINFKK